MLGIYNSYVASIPRTPCFLYICLHSHLQFPEIIKYALLVYFWEPSRPSKARMRADTEVRSALPSANRASLGGYYGGNPRTSPKNRQYFSKYFRLDPKLLVSLEKTGARRKQLRTGPAESRGRLRLRDTAPPSPPYTYVAYEHEPPRIRSSKSHTRTRK